MEVCGLFPGRLMDSVRRPVDRIIAEGWADQSRVIPGLADGFGEALGGFFLPPPSPTTDSGAVFEAADSRSVEP
jgi:hypothetical protein